MCDSGRVLPGALFSLISSLWLNLSRLLSHLFIWGAFRRFPSNWRRKVNMVGFYHGPEGDAGRAGAESRQELGTFSLVGRRQVTEKSPGPRLWSPVPEFPFQPLRCSCSVAVDSQGSTDCLHSKEFPLTCRMPPPLFPQGIGRPALCLGSRIWEIGEVRAAPSPAPARLYRVPMSSRGYQLSGRSWVSIDPQCLLAVGSKLPCFCQDYLMEAGLCLTLPHGLSSDNMPTRLFSHSDPGKRGL